MNVEDKIPPFRKLIGGFSQEDKNPHLGTGERGSLERTKIPCSRTSPVIYRFRLWGNMAASGPLETPTSLVPEQEKLNPWENPPPWLQNNGVPGLNRLSK